MKGILLSFVIAASLLACTSANQKEIGEVEGLISMVDEIERSFLSVDTSRAFLVKRQIDKDMKWLDNLNDTIDKATAIKIGEFYGGQKKIKRFYSNYHQLKRQIDFSKKQLESLKQDLTNGLIPQDKFDEYYRVEQGAIMELNSTVHKSIDGLDLYIEQLESDREEINKVFDELKIKTDENE